MRQGLRFVAICLALLSLAGCHSLQQSAEERPTAERADPPAAEVEPKEGRYTVITFAGTVEGISVNGQVRMAPDSLIWGSASKLIEVGRAMASPDSVWVRSALLGIRERSDYRRLQRKSGVGVTFEWLQETLLSDDAAERISALAQRFGYQADIRITRREQVERLTFPFNK